MKTAAAETQYSSEEALFLAFELSDSRWKMMTSVSLGHKPRERTMASGDLCGLHEEVARAKRRFGLSPSARVVSCYEAGRDGFWLHRYLIQAGIENIIVDPSSVEVNRRQRRAKTDRLDAYKLLVHLMRWWGGEKKVWSVVRVPSVEAEDQRHLQRELTALKRERIRHTNRIKSFLILHGVRLPVKVDFVERLAKVRLWDGSPLPPALRGRLEREYERLVLVRQQIVTLERQRREALASSKAPAAEKARRLIRLRAIGINGAWLLGCEVFGWREFNNRREVGALLGLTPTPHASGALTREQGISKAGPGAVRAMMVELAWGWLRFQPDSELTLWFHQRYGPGTRRSRRVGIVALARKLTIALWQYVETGVIPEGAVLKS